MYCWPLFLFFLLNGYLHGLLYGFLHFGVDDAIWRLHFHFFAAWLLLLQKFNNRCKKLYEEKRCCMHLCGGNKVVGVSVMLMVLLIFPPFKHTKGMDCTFQEDGTMTLDIFLLECRTLLQLSPLLL